MTPKPTQTDTIKAVLLKGEAIDSVKAFEQHHITRLSAIIERLRKKGYPIITARQKNNGIASYTLPVSWKH